MKRFVFFNNKNSFNLDEINFRAGVLADGDESIFGECLDTVVKELGLGDSYDDAMKKAELLSPFVLSPSDNAALESDTLFLPLQLTANEHGVENNCVFYVPVTHKAATLALDCEVSLTEDDDFISNLSFGDIERSTDGGVVCWNVSLYGRDGLKSKTIANLEVKLTHEAVFLEVWSDADAEFTQSVYVPNDELFSIYHSFDCDDFAFQSPDCVSDYEACALLSHEPGESTIIAEVGGLNLQLSESWSVRAPTGEFITPNNLFGTLGKKAVPSFIAWLRGVCVEDFADYECQSSPWFSIALDSGDIVFDAYDTFDEIPRDSNGVMLMLACALASRQFNTDAC